MGGQYSITSAGIDVGTTSTHLTLSRLTLADSSVPSAAPRLRICGREILYQSPIHETPVKDEGVIDGDGVAGLLSAEYSAAGISAEQVQSGAAIVTGESARLRNAAEVIERLSCLAGDFVIASAGPHLESVLAARGSGAARASFDRQNTICNVDVGGGTANIAIFQRGEAIDTACVGLGGRFLRLSREGRLLKVSDSGEVFLDAVAKEASTGQLLAPQTLELFGLLAAETILRAVLPGKPPQVTLRLLTTEPLRHDYAIDEFWFSGGVAELMGAQHGEPLRYGDMGYFLARGLVESMRERGVGFHVPPMAIRATVIGAGLHSLQLSGSTVTVRQESLPVRNLPVIRPFVEGLPDGEGAPQKMAEVILRCLDNHDLDWSTTSLAIALEKLPHLGFEALQSLAEGLSQAYSRRSGKAPLVVAIGDDVAMALGQLLRARLPGQPVVVLDGIGCQLGDYMDIGRPLAGGQAVPVVVKSLIFPR